MSDKMKKILFRIIAYVLDFCLVSVILLGLSYINFINPENPVINLKYEEYYNITERYNELTNSIGEYFEDGRLTEVEYNEIIKKYPEHFSVFDTLTLNEDIKNSDIETIKSELEKVQIEINNDFGYKIEKLNIRSTIISIVCYVLYFGVLQYILKGQTIFKKVFRIRVIDKNNTHKKIPLWKYIVRSILVCEIIITVIDLILLLSLKQGSYTIANGWMLQIKYIYEMIFLITLIIRDDARSIHDLILNTVVVRFDKHNNIIDEKLFNDMSDENESTFNKNNKIISKKSR